MSEFFSKKVLKRNIICAIYLVLAFTGACLTISANIDFMQTYGPSFDIANFIKLANINAAARSLSRDLFIGATAFFVWMILEAKRLNIKNMWIVILTTFTIAFAFSAPLFLFLRERRLIEVENN
tara:strand:- start:73 stop:444 length:372 start_codon:yes stop_codon:yes gene_type:complete